MKKVREEFDALVIMYRTLRDSDEIVNSDMFDSITFDIDGYCEEFERAEMDGDESGAQCLVSLLRKQVGYVSTYVIALKNINFRYV